jgi:hypothetical protein
MVVCALLVSLLVIMRLSPVRIFLTVWNVLTRVNRRRANNVRMLSERLSADTRFAVSYPEM